jgi:AmmeMemoRadiSam system protein B
MQRLKEWGQIVLILLLLTSGAAVVLGRWTSPSDSLHISGFVVPHHDIVAAERTRLFDAMSGYNLNPEAIILVSPNHYESGPEKVQSSNQTWKTLNGPIEPHHPVLSKLEESGLAANRPESFRNEHGIRSILGDIQRTFPGKPIVPLILSSRVTMTEAERLTQHLATSCSTCLLIASVDFSHYLPAPAADIHDDLSMRALANLEISTLYSKAEVDSPASLTMLGTWAKLHSTTAWRHWATTNAARIGHAPAEPSTSHVFGWYQNKSTKEYPQPFTFKLHTNLPKSTHEEAVRLTWGTDAIAQVAAKSTVPVCSTSIGDDCSQPLFTLTVPQPPQGTELVVLGTSVNNTVRLVPLLIDSVSGVPLPFTQREDLLRTLFTDTTELTVQQTFFGQKLHWPILPVHTEE